MTPDKDPAAVKLGQAGGKTTADKVRRGELPPDHYSKAGQAGAAARWGKPKEETDGPDRA